MEATRRQPSLFEHSPGTDASSLIPAKARRTDPATSHEAAAKVIRSGSAHSDRAMILEVIRKHRGITAGEIAEELGWGNDNAKVSRRTTELQRMRLVRIGPTRVCRAKRNRMMTWEAV